MTHFKTPATRSVSAGKVGSLYVEPSPRYYRLYDDAKSKEPIMQSKSAFLVWEGASYGLSLAFNKKDVSFASDETKGAGLVASNEKGSSEMASQYYDLISKDGKRIEGVAWAFTDGLPIEGPLKGQVSSLDLIAIQTNKFPLALEEDEPILDHVKNPYHRVDAVRTSRRIQVYAKNSSGEEVLVADTDKGNHEKTPAQAIFETALPTRWYLPADSLLVNGKGQTKMTPPPACDLKDYPKDGFTTVCPYKGVARYHSLELPDGSTLDNVIWSYPEAIPALDLRGLSAFWAPGNDRLRLVVDGEDVVI